ncbi:hypothetical protein VN21_14180 [Paraclostridium benzoelyticum]|uniref:Peptidase MA-like domain-containing protein n=1 Tax=Paraclostridium benzoelyticum TaxID=1629550 RepID=A0A0M3DCQ0_9FIRM|nr:hypothetical protein [Paraclostridium benzoelyticum]KKY00430.1 hypothetical protein VN21_14180 [Paraclostridium benzoelyticum]
MDRINFYARDLRVLKGIRDYLDFYNRINKIRKMFDFDKKIILDVMDDLKELEDLVEKKVPKWVIGTSFDNIILILDHDKWKKSNNETVENLILHEFVHVVLNLKSKGNLPIWLNEGLAVYFSNQYHSFKYQNFDNNIDVNFYDIDYRNENVYYIGVYVLIKLIDKYGIEKVVHEALNTENFETNQVFRNDNLLSLINNSSTSKSKDSNY